MSRPSSIVLDTTAQLFIPYRRRALLAEGTSERNTLHADMLPPPYNAHYDVTHSSCWKYKEIEYPLCDRQHRLWFGFRHADSVLVCEL